jgi:hypothetical protein
VFEVLGLDKTRAFIGDRAAAEAAKTLGVQKGAYYFLESGGSC